MTLPQPPVTTTCYRHPDREARRQCTRCGKVACGDCLVQATVGSHCLDCAKAARPSTAVRLRDAQARVLTPVTFTLIGINLVVFLWMTLLDPQTFSGRRTLAHIDLGLNAAAIAFNDEWYRVVTSGFIHYGIIHVLMNMFLLFQLGQLLERDIGSVRFGLVYAAGLLGGSAGVLLIEPFAVTGGASGAVFGLIGATAMGMHRRGINVFNTSIGTLLIVNLVLTFSLSFVSVGGHIGGLIAGGLCGAIVLAPGWKAPPKWAIYATPVAVIVLALVISWLKVDSLGLGA